MTGGPRRDRFELPDSVRRFFEGDWETAGMRVEEYLDGSTLVVRVDLPGVDPDTDVDITVSAGVLRIQAERREHVEHKLKEGYRSEFRYGTFVRDVVLPSGSKEGEVSAGYRDGVLEVRVPIADRSDSTAKVRVTRD